MASKSDTSLGTQVLIAVLVLLAAWIVLKWVIRVVVSVATTVVVVGAIVFAVWILVDRDRSA